MQIRQKYSRTAKGSGYSDGTPASFRFLSFSFVSLRFFDSFYFLSLTHQILLPRKTLDPSS